ncbi:MAG TPA: hypothetical protein VGK87_16965 [Anaerolineae bacterium]
MIANGVNKRKPKVLVPFKPKTYQQYKAMLADFFTRLTGLKNGGYPDINCGKSEKWWLDSWMSYKRKIKS